MTTLLDSLNVTTNVESYATTGGATPTASRVLIVLASLTDTVAAFGISDTYVSGGLTWTRRDANDEATWAVWTATTPGSGLLAGNVTVTCTGDAATGCFIAVFQEDLDTTTPLTQLSARKTGTAGTPDCDFAAASQSDGKIIAIFRKGGNPPAITEPSGYTEDLDVGHATPTTGWEVAHHDSPGSVTTVTWGSTTTGAWDTRLLELNPAAASPAATSLLVSTVSDVQRVMRSR